MRTIGKRRAVLHNAPLRLLISIYPKRRMPSTMLVIQMNHSKHPQVFLWQSFNLSQVSLQNIRGRKAQDNKAEETEG